MQPPPLLMPQPQPHHRNLALPSSPRPPKPTTKTIRHHIPHRPLAQRPIHAARLHQLGIQKPFTRYPDSNQPVLEALWQIFRFGRQNEDLSLASAKVIFMLLIREDMRQVMESHWENARKAMERMGDEMEGWRFAATATGYMGLFPEEVKKGDEVWVVEGGKVPLLLRRSKTAGAADDAAAAGSAVAGAGDGAPAAPRGAGAVEASIEKSGGERGGPGDHDDPRKVANNTEGIQEDMMSVDETDDGTDDAKDGARQRDDMTTATLEVPVASSKSGEGEQNGLNNSPGQWTKQDANSSVVEAVWEYEIVGE